MGKGKSTDFVEPPKNTTSRPEKIISLSYSARLSLGRFWTGLWVFGLIFGVATGFRALFVSLVSSGRYTFASYKAIAELFPALWFILFLVPSVVGRWHDHNKSGWNIFWIVIPYAGWLYMFFKLCLKPGSPEPNQYDET